MCVRSTSRSVSALCSVCRVCAVYSVYVYARHFFSLSRLFPRGRRRGVKHAAPLIDGHRVWFTRVMKPLFATRARARPSAVCISWHLPYIFTHRRVSLEYRNARCGGPPQTHSNCARWVSHSLCAARTAARVCLALLIHKAYRFLIKQRLLDSSKSIALLELLYSNLVRRAR